MVVNESDESFLLVRSDHKALMDEIVRARVELLQLKEIEQDFCHKLSRVRMDIEY